MKVTSALIDVVFDKDHAATTVLLASHWLRAHSDDLRISCKHAKMLCRMNRYEDAARAYEDALGKIDPSDRDRWIIFAGLGELYRKWGRLPEAEPWYQKAIEINPDKIAGYIFLGACQARQGKLKEAEATHRATTQMTGLPLLDEAYHNLGLVLRGQDRLAEAAECFRKAIELDPKYADAIEALADVETSWPDEVTKEMIREAFNNYQAATAVQLASRWLQAHPDDFFVTLDYAEVLYQMTRYKQAIDVYESALGKFENQWGIFNQLGHMNQYWGRPADAEPWFRKAIELEPDELVSYMFLGECQARQGNLKDAEATYRAATKWTESSSLHEAYENLGLVLRGQSRFAEAADCFQKAIEIDPDHTKESVVALADVEVAMMLTQEGLE